MAKKKTCTVRWAKTRDVWAAVLYDKCGHSINYMAGWKRKPSASARRKAEARLKRGCAELSRSC